jgi:DNA-binding winged helix-turn-helix (wHTH) protein/tetratricopeptide (TPR) repeat protein
MPNIVRFGPFELNLETADLKGIGPGTRLPEQQFQILRMLLLCEGGVVSRDEIRRRLWPGDTVVEFDGSINAAILKLRSAMRAESSDDGFIETVARRGYRLLIPVQDGRQSSQRAIPESSGQESIEGETLQDLISKLSGASGNGNRRPPLPQLLDLATQLVDGLGAVHLDGIVHRSVRPANIFIAPNGKVKFLVGGSDADADYLSPEQLRGEPLDQRSDLFSLGIVLAELLNGIHPFRRIAKEDTRQAILNDIPNLGGDLPDGLIVLLRRLLAKSTELRYHSIAEVRGDLQRLSADLSATHDSGVVAGIPLIGRDLEFAELKRLLNEALAGRGSMVMIGGEPGIGKTHIARAVLEEAKHRGAVGVIGHCYEMEGTLPYVPFVEVLEYISRMAPREGFRQSLGDDAPEVARLMPELRTIYPDIPLAAQLPPEQQRRSLFNAFRSYVERASRVTPVVVVFEDLHWADEPTLLLLQHLAQTISTAPMFMVCTYRDAGLDATRPFAGALETLVRHKQAARLLLRRLPLSGVKGMLAALGGQPPPEPLVHAIFEETDGNPFFVEEVFRYLSEEGKLFDERGKWLPGLREEDLQVPASVRLVLGRRLQRLSEGAQRVLTIAAVIGRSFSLRLLDELENKQPDTVLDAIEEAERAQLVVPERDRRDTRYRFVHELVRQTLAESLLLPRRQRLHMRIADAVERVYSEKTEAQASSLAHHLYQAGALADRERTTGYLLMAVSQARTGAAHEEALEHLDRAISLWEGETSLRMAELMNDRASTLRNMGRADEAVTSYRLAIELFESNLAIARMVEASIALSYLLAWRLDLAGEIMERAYQKMAGQDPQLQSSVLSMRAAIMSATGEPVAADLMFDDVRALHKSMTAPSQGPSLLLEAIHYYQSFQINRVSATISRLANACRADGDLWNASAVEFYGLWAEMYSGRPGKAASELPAAVLRAEKIGHYGAVWALKIGASIASGARGDLVAAENETREAWEFGVAHEVGWNFAAGLQAGHIALWRGNLAEAEGWYSRGPKSDGKSYLSGLSEACLFAAFAENRDPRAEQAWARRRWKSPLLGQLNPLGSWVALERSVIGLAHMDRKVELAALRPATEELLLTGAWTYSLLSPFRTVAGIAAAAAGDWSSAEEHHRTAIHQTDTAPYHHLQPLAREWYAKMLIDRNGHDDIRNARPLLEEAIAMYNSSAFPLRGKHSIELLAKLSDSYPIRD